MREIAEIKQELLDLDARLQKLESAKISGEGITAGDILYLTGRQESLRADVRALEARLQGQSGVRPVYPVPPVPPVPPKRLVSFPKPVREKRKLDERVLGKYLVGVLASVLVLLAVGVLIASVWSEIPDAAKFGMFLLAGIGLEAAGAYFVKKGGTGNGFWSSLTGLGSGICFLALASGCIIWHLYPMAVAGLAGVLWFGAQFLIASRFGSWPFYAVAYTGGIVAIWLAAPAGMASVFDELPMVFMAGAILLIGMAGNRFRPKPWLPAMNALLASLAAYKIDDCMWMDAWIVGSPAYRPWLSASVAAALAFLVLGQAYEICPPAFRLGKYKKLLDVALIACAACQLAVRCDSLRSRLDISEPLALLLCLALTVAAIALARSRWNLVLLGTTPALVFVLAELSDVWTDERALLPCLVALGLVLVARIRNGGRLGRLTAWLWAMSSAFLLFLIQSDGWRRGDAAPFALFCALLAICLATGTGAVLYWGVLKRDEGCLPDLELLSAMGIMTLGAARLAQLFFDIDQIPAMIVAAGLLYHRWAVMRKRRPALLWHIAISLLWTAAAFLLCGYVHILMLFADDLEQSLGISILLAFSCSSICAAIVSDSRFRRIRTVFAVLFANWTMFFSGNIVTGLTGLVISVLGLVLAAGFIALGFWRRSKDMRLLGLGCMILYVLKISLFDVQGSSGIFGTAGGLLLGGLICFGVSFAYNRIDRLYDRTEEKDPVLPPVGGES